MMAARTHTQRLAHLAARARRRPPGASLAVLDPETGLPGRTQLRADLDASIDPQTILLVGLQAAHGCGPEWLEDDPELPRRIALALAAAVRPLGAQPYLMDGLLFAVVGPAGLARDLGVTTAREALAGAAGDPGASVVHGEAHLPHDGVGDAALAVAVRRLRGRARRHGLSAERQVRDVLLALLAERRAGGSPVSMPKVASHAMTVGRKLGLSLEQLDDLVRAAELQDIGKLVIPESIIAKRGSLTNEEWTKMHEHPLIAERIIGAAPSLTAVARLVRSCAERWDGSGYPDGLCGEAIPLGSRIVAVCVAFDAMTSARPYRAPLDPVDALGELWRCAGQQFDPIVVSVFCAAVAEVDPPDARVASEHGQGSNMQISLEA